jgi:hypothetical protein
MILGDQFSITFTGVINEGNTNIETQMDGLLPSSRNDICFKLHGLNH